MLFYHVLIFVGSFAILFFSSNFLVGGLTKLSKFIGWKEFVVSFLVMAFATTIPNFFIGIISALNKVPELSFSDVVGTNIADLTLVIALSALVSKMGLSVPSRTVQGSSLFTIGVAVFPLILIQDGTLSRLDGILLLGAFAAYIAWLFNKKERFEKIYDGTSEKLTLKFFTKNIVLLFCSILLLVVSSHGIVKSAVFFSGFLRLPLSLIGILIVGLGTALPELSFTLQAARKSQDWMIVGDVMGSVIMTATLVLGIVALICPIKIVDFQPFAIGRIFLIISAIFFLLFIRSGRKITRREALFLLGIYITFVLVEILSK
ncbi:MAG: sodium:calcium antiporter [Candidatus Nealsonbacteria bacterium]|nr:sodium:calcium antiporter [Candidatus Nealsonbacteria bacterium]